MPRQELIPGKGYLDETSGRQYFMPGWSFVNDSEPINFAVSYTETMACSDAEATSAHGSLAMSENPTAVDGFPSLPVYRQESIPGGYFLNETANRQYFIAGIGYANDTSPYLYRAAVSAVYGFGLTFSAATGDGKSSTARPTVTVSDFAYASDVPPAPPSLPSLLGRARYGAAEYASAGVASTTAKIAPSGPSSLYGGLICGAALYGSVGGSSPSPTFKPPYVYVSWSELTADGALAGDSLDMSLAFSGFVNEVLSAEFMPLMVFPTPADRIIEAGSKFYLVRTATASYLEKATDEVEDFTIDWGAVLGEDTIVTSEWSVEPQGLGHASPAASNTATTTKVWLSGGEEGVSYTVINTITTAGGRALQQHFFCKTFCV